MTALAHVGWSVPGGLGAAVEDRLDQIIDPCSTASVLPMSIVEMGLVADVTLAGGRLAVHLRLTSPSCLMVGYIAREVEERLAGLADGVDVVPDAGLDWDPGHVDPEIAAERARRLTFLDLKGLARPAG
ncbi:metal-sulfur cluster assembly factor [Jiangella endophytica]|uniref:metal-sulfur cluster assembly factor n=1 Tax=Jiangella endophytica TaxID=1623398 RepID=UPI000E3553AD|nr:iron-sulfur cluster assembly protein [Jiangella endophytica]